MDKFAHVTRFGSFVAQSRLLASKYHNIPRVAARNSNSKALERARSGICPRGLVCFAIYAPLRRSAKTSLLDKLLLPARALGLTNGSRVT